MQGFLIDGFPMDVNQAKAFEADIGSPKAILFFEANDEVKKTLLVNIASLVAVASAVLGQPPLSFAAGSCVVDVGSDE